MLNDERIYDTIKTIIEESNNIVAIMGIGAVIESGGIDLWDRDVLYGIEHEYGLSPEEILSAGEFATRKERFYRFYRDKVLSDNAISSDTFHILKKLEEMGKLSCVVSMNISGLEKQTGIENVVELYGSIYDNYCPVCKGKYSIDYLRNYPDTVPVCSKCKAAIRPNIRLMGERIQNDLYTKAVVECSKADALLVLGTTLYGEKIRYCTGHYIGDKLILINNEEHFSDKYADIVCHDFPKNVLSRIFTLE